MHHESAFIQLADGSNEEYDDVTVHESGWVEATTQAERPQTVSFSPGYAERIIPN